MGRALAFCSKASSDPCERPHPRPATPAERRCLVRLRAARRRRRRWGGRGTSGQTWRRRRSKRRRRWWWWWWWWWWRVGVGVGVGAGAGAAVWGGGAARWRRHRCRQRGFPGAIQATAGLLHAFPDTDPAYRGVSCQPPAPARRVSSRDRWHRGSYPTGRGGGEVTAEVCRGKGADAFRPPSDIPFILVVTWAFVPRTVGDLGRSLGPFGPPSPAYQEVFQGAYTDCFSESDGLGVFTHWLQTLLCELQ